MLIDSGSSKNVIDDETWEYMKAQCVTNCSPCRVPNTILRGYGRDARPLTIIMCLSP